LRRRRRRSRKRRRRRRDEKRGATKRAGDGSQRWQMASFVCTRRLGQAGGSYTTPKVQQLVHSVVY
jgi:hypothetical protein